MGKLGFKLLHVMPHVWFYKHKEVVGRNDSKDNAEAAFVYRRSTSMRLVKSKSSTDERKEASTAQDTIPPDGDPIKSSKTRTVKPERSRKGKEMQVCTVVDAGCTCRATVTSQHKDKGKNAKARAAGASSAQSYSEAPSSNASRFSCKSTEDVVRRSKARNGVATKQFSNLADADITTQAKGIEVYSDVDDLEGRLKSVGLEGRKKHHGSPRSSARVASPLSGSSPRQQNYAGDSLVMGIEDSSTRFSDERSSFSRLCSTLPSCRPSSSERGLDGIANCEEGGLYMSHAGTLSASQEASRSLMQKLAAEDASAILEKADLTAADLRAALAERKDAYRRAVQHQYRSSRSKDQPSSENASAAARALLPDRLHLHHRSGARDQSTSDRAFSRDQAGFENINSGFEDINASLAAPRAMSPDAKRKHALKPSNVSEGQQLLHERPLRVVEEKVSSFLSHGDHLQQQQQQQQQGMPQQFPTTGSELQHPVEAQEAVELQHGSKKATAASSSSWRRMEPVGQVKVLTCSSSSSKDGKIDVQKQRQQQQQQQKLQQQDAKIDVQEEEEETMSRKARRARSGCSSSEGEEGLITEGDNSSVACSKLEEEDEVLHGGRSTSATEIRSAHEEVFESVAMVKSSYDPQQDFKESMLEMVLAKQLQSSHDLQQLLQCYLSLNPPQYHGIIVHVFQEVWSDLFQHTS